jgi:hypothetical protein
MALVGKAGGGGGGGDRLAGFEQAAGVADPVGDLQRVWWKADPLAEQAGEMELVNAGSRGELVEADVALWLVGQVLTGLSERPVVAEAEWRSRQAGR